VARNQAVTGFTIYGLSAIPEVHPVTGKGGAAWLGTIQGTVRF